jgi:hypothetical protein
MCRSIFSLDGQRRSIGKNRKIAVSVNFSHLPHRPKTLFAGCSINASTDHKHECTVGVHVLITQRR